MEYQGTSHKSAARMPAAFISHGAPTAVLEDDDYARALGRFGRSMARPEAVVIVSAHWQSAGPIRVNAAAHPGLIYDFYGFPPELYNLTYPAPGAPALAKRIAAMLGAEGVAAAVETGRGWDHGVWIPLRLLFPEADVPVVQLSLGTADAAGEQLRLGQLLAPLRDEGVMLVGSGGLVHNLGLLRPDPLGPPESWAVAFEQWVSAQIKERNWAALASNWTRAPHARLAAPTSEHFDPLFFPLGSAADEEAAHDLYVGYRFRTLSMRCLVVRGGNGTQS
jgi:4,5-DOPA dioxygenase extradiol